jgi:copper chaperone CopZ
MKWYAVLAGTVLGALPLSAGPARACGGGCCRMYYMPMQGMQRMQGMQGMQGMQTRQAPTNGPSMPDVPGMRGMPSMTGNGGAAATVKPNGKTDKVILAISGMHCADCAARVKKALASVPGVTQTQVNYDMEVATVQVESDKHDEPALLDALRKAGYGGKVVK